MRLQLKSSCVVKQRKPQERTLLNPLSSGMTALARALITGNSSEAIKLGVISINGKNNIPHSVLFFRQVTTASVLGRQWSPWCTLSSLTAAAHSLLTTCQYLVQLASRFLTIAIISSAAFQEEIISNAVLEGTSD